MSVYPKTEDYRAAFHLLGYRFTMRNYDKCVLCNGEEIDWVKQEEINCRMRDINPLFTPTQIKSQSIYAASQNVISGAPDLRARGSNG